MTVSVFNKLGGQKTGQTFSGADASKEARFQFDFERPTHCLLEEGVANVTDDNVNCTVFPISLDEDITAVLPRTCFVAYVLLLPSHNT